VPIAGWEDPDPADVLVLAGDAEWQTLAARYPSRNGEPLRRCLEVARSNGALSVVIETRYMDPDYRSEYAALYARTFASQPDTAVRLHFFKAPLAADQLWQLPLDHGYLGYLIIRPTELGRVGRSMLVPPPGLEDAALTAVDERVHFFGQTLSVRGVPFMQQDAQLDRCAHAAAWVCHYSAFRRGMVARRPIAAFNLMADLSLGRSRSIPSDGLTAGQLVELFRVFDLPARLYEIGALPPIIPAPPGAPPDPVPKTDANGQVLPGGMWDTRLFGTVCRYLNSGLPVLVATKDHAFVLCGYRRRPRANDRDWIEFIRQDDQRGPYLNVDNVFNDSAASGHSYGPWRILIVPLPEKLWLPPEPAEGVGSRLMERVATVNVKAVPDAKTLLDIIASGTIAFRTYATAANDFKEKCLGRLPNELTREYRLARFSRLIWVVEAIDKAARDRGEGSHVLGEAIFDATSSEYAPAPLAVHVPGLAWLVSTTGSLREVRCAPDRYSSGTGGTLS